MVTFYHFDVVGILTSEEDFHREKLGKIYYSVYEHCCVLRKILQLFFGKWIALPDPKRTYFWHARPP